MFHLLNKKKYNYHKRKINNETCVVSPWFPVSGWFGIASLLRMGSVGKIDLGSVWPINIAIAVYYCIKFNQV